MKLALARTIFLSALLGCDFLPPAQTGSCDDPSDCAETERCTIPTNQTLGVCTTTATENPLFFTLDISPLPDSGLLRTVIPIGLQPSPLADLGEISIETSVDVNGRVVIFGSEERPRILVRAIATNGAGVGPKELFEGLCDEEGFFTLSLRPGSYDVFAIPVDNTSLPPTLLRSVSLPTDPGQDFVIALQNNRFLQGRIVSENLGVEGLRVFASAFDPETGIGAPDLRSSIAETAEDGSFLLSLPQDVNTLSLHVEPLAASANPDLPSLQRTIDVSTLVVDAVGVLQLSVVDLGSTEDSVEVQGSVTGPAASSGAPPIAAPAGTVLRFTRIEPSETERSFSRRVVLEKDGRYELHLLPGSYQVEVTCPPESEFASEKLGEFTLSCEGAACEPLSLSLKRRNKFFGQIFNIAGDVLAESFRIEAHPAARPEDTTQVATSDKSGRGYEIFLDPAVYDLSIVPTSTQSLATWFAFDINASSGDNRVDVVVAPASLLQGTVLRQDAGVPISGASVRVFARDVQGRSWPLTSTTTDQAGRFLLVLPNPQDTSLSKGPLVGNP